MISQNLIDKLKTFLRSARIQQDGFIRIGPRQIYTLPTRFGLIYGALVISMLIGSINYANNLGYLLTFLLASLGIMTIIQTWRNLLGLEITVFPNEAVFAGQNGSFNFKIKNPDDKERGAILLQDDKEAYDLHNIAGQSEQTFVLKRVAIKRGWLKPERFILSTRYPFGLVHAWVYVYADTKVLAYPKPADNWDVPTTADYELSSSGDKGKGSDDFVAHRPYRDNDSPRQIDWKIFAREKGLMSKQFGGDRSERLWLSLDLLPGKHLETRLQFLSRAILDAQAKGLEYGLKLDGEKIDISHGPQHQHFCLKALALYGENS